MGPSTSKERYTILHKEGRCRANQEEEASRKGIGWLPRGGTRVSEEARYRPKNGRLVCQMAKANLEKIGKVHQKRFR